MKKYRLKTLAARYRKTASDEGRYGIMTAAYDLLDGKDLDYFIMKTKAKSPMPEAVMEEAAEDDAAPEATTPDSDQEQENEPDPEPETSEPKEEKPKRKRQPQIDHGAKPKAKRGSIDKGKIIALYKANWSAGKIAGEMHCEISSVYKAIRAYNNGEIKLDNEVWNERA